MKREYLCLSVIFTLCLYVCLLSRAAYAQESDDVHVNDAYLDVMSLYAQEPIPPAPEHVAEVSFGKLLKEWTPPIKGNWYPRERLRRRYSEATQNLNAESTLLVMHFPDRLVVDGDYIQALHWSYTVWGLSKNGNPVNAPIEEWLNLVIDKGRVAPEHSGYVDSGVEITTLLLETYIRLYPDASSNTPFLLNYLERMKHYSPAMFDKVLKNIIDNSTVFKDTKTLGILFISLGRATLGNDISSLYTPSPSFIEHLPRNEFHVGIVEPGEYVDWVKNTIKPEDLEAFKFPFPESIASDSDYLRALHWSYVVWALAKNDMPVNAPVLTWLNNIVAMKWDQDTSHRSYYGLGGLAAVLLETHLLMAPTQEKGVKHMLQSFRGDGLLPMSKLKIDVYEDLWGRTLCPRGILNDEKGLLVLLLNIDEVVGNDLERLRLLLKGIQDCTSRQGLDLKNLWPPEAYDKVVELSKNKLPGSYEPRNQTSIRQIAWDFRLRGYHDVMSREVALTMTQYKKRTLADIYVERYQYVWFSSWIPVLLLLFGSRRRVGVAIFSAGASTSLFVIIFFCATIAGLGHNTANISGFLGVLEYCFPFYGIAIAFLWLGGLRHIVAQYWRQGSH